MTNGFLCIPSNVKLFYLLPIISNVKTRNDISLPHQFAGDIFLSSNYNLNNFSVSSHKYKENLHISKSTDITELL